jgi:3-isopropylmalate/(R)-2-methylmalate dehydratase large subunit
MSQPRTLFQKIWDDHEIKDFGNGYSLLHVDRDIMHDLLGSLVFEPLDKRGMKMPNPELHFATMDHGIETETGRTDETKIAGGKAGVQGLRRKCREYGITMFDLGDERQGICHVFTPEQGIALPGSTLICGDSHTSTIGGLGLLAWGVGLTEIEHVLATQTIVAQKPKTMRITFEGKTAPGVTAKDMILYTIGQLGAKAGNGYVVEYAGEAVRALPVEARLTMANMSIEMAARYGMIAADDTTFDYLKGRPYAPKGEMWDKAVEYWRTLPTDDGAVFDREETIDATKIVPMITWGTSPQDVIGVDGHVPDPAKAGDADKKAYLERALAYTGLTPGAAIEDTPIDVAFIGSCTNARISDLRAAANILKGRKVADGIQAWCVPGSGLVKKEAEAEGIDKVFKEAGFEWREPGCSMCVSLGGDKFKQGGRAISSTNRNFENRQGVGVRTHLASPEMVAAAAVTGKVTDIRKLAS